MINKLLRILLVLVVLYFLIGAFLMAYYEIIIYPDSLSGIFEPVAKHIRIIHESACEVLEKLLTGFQAGLSAA